MATRHSPLAEQRRSKLNERLMWLVATVAALFALILKHDGKGMAAPGTAKLAGEYGDSILDEYRQRFSR